MKKSSIIALIITIVVISPCIVGYAVPTGEVTETSYKAGDFVNMTGSLADDSIPIFGDYYGVENNAYAIGIDDSVTPVKWITGTFEPVRRTQIQSPYVNVKPVGESVIEKSNGFVPTVNPGQYYTEYHVNSPGKWSYSDGFSYGGVRCYENGRVDLLTDGGVIPDVHDVKLSLNQSRISVTISDYKIKSYTDPTKGWYVPDTDSMLTGWTNGLDNNRVDIILSTVEFSTEMSMSFKISDNRLQEEYDTITIHREGFDWYVDELIFGQESYHLGTTKAYEYILLSIDAAQHEIRVSGLIGLNDFSDKSYPFKTANTIVQPYDPTVTEIYGIDITGQDTFRNRASMAVVGTTVPNGYAYGIRDTPISVNSWIPGSYVMTLNQTAVYGSYIKIGDREFYLDGGRIDVNGSKFPVSGLEIMAISEGPDEGTYVNNERIGAFTDQIFMAGSWMTQVMAAGLDAVTVNNFVWTPGGFGLDMQGFCSVGLLASLGAFIVVGLIGRRDGGNMAVALITSAISGIVYLILLM